jgi:N-acetylmuramoyl-L-alanine amidase
LTAKYQPKDTSARKSYEASLQESARLKAQPVRSRDLSDVVVILDPGHGGEDHGTYYPKKSPTLLEDEINYDIVMRIKALLEKETAAKVHVTMVDKSAGYTSTAKTSFVHDTDEELLTNPRHSNNVHADVSVNLRWMLVNKIYDQEIKRGVDPRKVVFTSIHTDYIFNSSVRGAMIYIPGAKYRRSEEVRRGAVYAKYSEGKYFNRFTSTSSERRLDEALSRNFAEVLLAELGAKRIKRHDNGDPIRTVIRRSKKEAWVPGVIRNTKVPTKILVETANMQNATDRKWLADPWWRQQFAQAYVDALKRYYGSSTQQKYAQTD